MIATVSSLPQQAAQTENKKSEELFSVKSISEDLGRRWKTPFSTSKVKRHSTLCGHDSEGCSYFDIICTFVAEFCVLRRNEKWIHGMNICPSFITLPLPSLSILQKFYYCPRLPLTGTQCSHLANNFIKILGPFQRQERHATGKDYFNKI